MLKSKVGKKMGVKNDEYIILPYTY